MAKPKGGLTKWFREGWVDISRKEKVEDIHHVAESQQEAKVVTQNVYLLVKPLE